MTQTVRSRGIPYITEIYRKIEGMINSVTGAAKVEITSPLESNGAVPVNIQDQTTPVIGFFFSQIQSAPTTVAVEAAVDDLSVTVADASGCLVGDLFGMFNADDPLDNRAYFGTIMALPGANVVKLDTPLDFPFKVGDTAACFNPDISTANGTLEDPQVFTVEVGSGAAQSIDITRLMFECLTDTPGDLEDFGDIAGGLVNGLVIRRVDGTVNNYGNIKTNGDVGVRAFDYRVYEASNPSQGQDGFLARLTFAGQSKQGVVVRLGPGDRLELLVRDDLTSLAKFRILAQGHYVGD